MNYRLLDDLFNLGSLDNDSYSAENRVSYTAKKFKRGKASDAKAFLFKDTAAWYPNREIKGETR